MIYTFDLLKLVLYLLASFTAGYGVSMLLDKLDDIGWKPFSRTRVIKIDPSDPRFTQGVIIGTTAGYWAATGEDKEYSEILEEYLDRLDAEGKR